MAIRNIKLEAFTVFDKIEIELCDGINVFIGENGTGKTHLLKLLYFISECEMQGDSQEYNGNSDMLEKLRGCFQVASADNLFRDLADRSLICAASDSGECSFSLRRTCAHKSTVDLNSNGSSNGKAKKPIPAIFIPAKEMLTHSGLEKDFMQRNLPFDITLIDILNKAGVSTMKSLPDYMLNIMNRIAQIIDGTVLYKNNRYYVEKSNGTLVDFAAEAEGFKKLGLVYRLIETGYLKNGSVLIWDEPESNINPHNIPFIVDILLDLHKCGVQVFLATHNYFFAKYLDVRKTAEHSVQYHALFMKESAASCEQSLEFEGLLNNAIIEQSINLYREEVKKVME